MCEIQASISDTFFSKEQTPASDRVGPGSKLIDVAVCDSDESRYQVASTLVALPTARIGIREKVANHHKEVPRKRRSSGTSTSVCSKISLENLRRRKVKIELKLHKAARLELAFLDRAAAAGQKRSALTQLLNLLTCNKFQDLVSQEKGAPLSLPELSSMVSGIESNLKKMAQAESKYHAKSAQVRRKRSQWSKMYKQTNAVLLQQSSRANCLQSPTQEVIDLTE